MCERLLGEIHARIGALAEPFSGSVDDDVARLARGEIGDIGVVKGILDARLLQE
ncbi:hypothetical protein ACFL25_00340 [Patescibacteria group bacterium]